MLLSTSRTMPGGFADRAALPKGTNGRTLCRWCSLEVPTRRFTFCSDWCVHEWRLRSDPGYLREQVLRRDRGVCAICRVDTRAAYGELRRSRGSHRLRLLAKWGSSGSHARVCGMPIISWPSRKAVGSAIWRTYAPCVFSVTGGKLWNCGAGWRRYLSSGPIFEGPVAGNSGYSREPFASINSMKAKPIFVALLGGAVAGIPA